MDEFTELPVDNYDHSYQVLQHEIDSGLADIEAGRVIEGEEVMQQLRKRIRNVDI